MSNSLNKPQVVLLVDDDPSMRQLLSMVFEDGGFSVLTAAHGKQAIQVLEQNPVDLIVLDSIMPVMDGYRFLEWLRSTKQSSAPVLSLTSATKAGQKEALLEAGATSVIFKPASANSIIAKARELVAG